RSFRQLELQQIGVEAVLAQNTAHDIHEIAPLKLLSRHVDRHPHSTYLGRPPQADLPARPAQFPPALWLDQAGLLGEGDELSRRDAPTLWMVPTDQSLGALDSAG